MPVLLMGPGRWGTTTPSLGVPVTFSEINKIAVLAEIAYEGGNLMPELSFGTHFFRDLVETDIFYVALFPRRKTVIFDKARLSHTPNLLEALLPGSKKYADVIEVFDVEKERLHLIFDVLSQKVVCYFS
jgi:hypothetical protein